MQTAKFTTGVEGEGRGHAAMAPLTSQKSFSTLVFLVKTIIILDINLISDPLNFYQEHVMHLFS